MAIQNNALTSVNVSTPVQQHLDIPEILHNGQRVITLSMMDAAHKRPEGTAKRNFNANKDKFEVGEDYFSLGANEFRTRLDPGHSKFANEDVVLLTESGYLTLVRSFTDELAWKVQKQLVKGYFKAKQLTQGKGSVAQLVHIFDEQMAVSQKLEVPVHIAQAIALTEIYDQTGKDFSKTLEHAPAQIAAKAVATAKERPLEPALAKYLEKTVPDEDYEPISKLMWLFDVTEAQVHTVFRENGLLESVNRKWKRTLKGCKVSKQFTTKPGDYEIRWDTNVVNPMIRATLNHYPLR